MELRQIKSFIVVADELHFGRAATKLNIAQPAVTAQIKALELELGVQLFLRSTRRVTLTEAGEVFKARSHQLLRDLDRNCAAAQATAGKDLGKITIGTTHSATFGVLPKFLTRINQRFPNIQIHIHNGTTDDIIKGLERGSINIGFVRPVENIGSLRWQAIGRERYFLAIANDNELLKIDEITLEDLRGQKIISFERSTQSYSQQYFSEKFLEYGLNSSITCTCNDTLSMLALVTAGVGVGFVPEWVAATPGRNFQLRSVEGVDLAINLGFAWSSDDPTVNRDVILDFGRELAD